MTTFKGTAGLVIPTPGIETVILVVPNAIPVATPSGDIVAMLGSELVQIKPEVNRATDPSE